MLTICVLYNDKKVLNDMLLASLKNQSIKIQWILIDNSKNAYNSHAEAYNQHLHLIEYDTVMFAHQDIEIFGDLSMGIKYLNQSKPMIIGSAGKAKDGMVYSNVTHGKDKTYAGKGRVKRLKKVETLDENLIMMKSDLIQKYHFNESLHLGFHLYAAELCYRLKMHNIPSYVFPIALYHLSKGNKDSHYEKALIQLINDLKHHYKTLYLTTGIYELSKIKNQPIDAIDERLEVSNFKKRNMAFKKAWLNKNYKKMIISIVKIILFKN